jgi:hypothetical protein
MNFIDAVLLIAKSKDLYLCDSEREREGRHSNICVYSKTINDPISKDFIGKLHWPKGQLAAYVDGEVEALLKEEFPVEEEGGYDA